MLVVMGLAVTMDFFEGTDPEDPLNPYTALAERFDVEDWTRARFDHTAYDTFRHFSKSIEEAIEMFSMSLFLYVFIRHLTSMAGELRLRMRQTST